MKAAGEGGHVHPELTGDPNGGSPQVVISLALPFPGLLETGSRQQKRSGKTIESGLPAAGTIGLGDPPVDNELIGEEVVAHLMSEREPSPADVKMAVDNCDATSRQEDGGAVGRVIAEINRERKEARASVA